jgi:hypothetical protein
VRGRASDSRALSWLGGLAIVLVTGVIAAVIVMVVFDRDDQSISTDTVLNREVTLRSSPDAASAALATLAAGAPVTVTVRSADGRWVAVAVEGRGFIGWAPSEAIDNLAPTPRPAEATVAARATASASPTASGSAAAPTQTPDFPDLELQAIYSRDNRLVVAITNVGDVDVDGAIFVIVDNGEPVQKSVGGKPLRPGDTLEAVLDREYVQRRGAVTVEVRLADGIEEGSLDNNKLEVVLSPDVPNDLEVSGIALDTETATLTVSIGNNSIIPIVGVATIAVRETAPSSALIARFDVLIKVEAGATQEHKHILEVEGELPDVANLLVILFSSALNDAVDANNTFPR